MSNIEEAERAMSKGIIRTIPADVAYAQAQATLSIAKSLEFICGHLDNDRVANAIENVASNLCRLR